MSAHQKKTSKYIDLKTDLVKSGWTTSLVPFEIGSRGQVTKNNNKTIRDMMKLVNIHTQHQKLVTGLSRISLLASFSIFHARCQPSWESPPSSNHRQPTCTAALWRNPPARGLDLCYSLIVLSFIFKKNISVITIKESALWADSFYKSKCPHVCLFVCPSHFLTPFNSLFAPTF